AGDRRVADLPGAARAVRGGGRRRRARAAAPRLSRGARSGLRARGVAVERAERAGARQRDVSLAAGRGGGRRRRRGRPAAGAQRGLGRLTETLDLRIERSRLPPLNRVLFVEPPARLTPSSRAGKTLNTGPGVQMNTFTESPTPDAVRAVLALFDGPLAAVRFPQVDKESLAEQIAVVEQRRAELQRALEAVQAARAGL